MPTPTRGHRHPRAATPSRVLAPAVGRAASRAPRHRRALRALGSLASLLLLALAPSRALAQAPDLVLNVVDSPDPVPATGVVTYAVTIANNGASTATGITYTMTVPASASYNGFTAGSGASCSGMTIGATGPGTITCTHPNLAFNESGTFTVRLRLNALGTITVPQSVSSTIPEPPGTSGDNSVSPQTTVNAGANVAVQLTAPATAPAGGAIGFTIAVTNAGPSAATNLRVQFPVPSGVAITSLPGGCSNSAGTITCDLAGSIAVGGSTTVGTVNGTVTVVSGSSITGVATVGLQPSAPGTAPRDPDTGDNTSTRTVSVSAGSDLRLTKTRSTAGPYFVGGGFSFLLNTSFTGDAPTSVTVTDTIPANYTIGAVAPSQGGWSCSVSGQIVTCTRAGGGIGGNNISYGQISIPVTINAAGTPTNRAHVAALSPADPTPGNNVGSDGGTTLLAPSADLAVSKTGPNPALAVVGQSFTWTLAVSNGGPSPFSGQLVLTDSVPTGITISGITPNGWSCPATPISGPAELVCTRTVTSGAPMPSGGSVPSVQLTATATTDGAFTNIVNLTTVSPSVPDLNTANNRSTNAVTVSQSTQSANLRVIKTADLATVPAGDVLRYTLELENAGPVTSTNISMTDALPTLINNGVGPTGQGLVGVTVLQQGVASAVTCTSASTGGTSRTVTCTVPSLPVCTVGVDCPRVEIAIRPGGDGGTRNNSATAISSSTADPDLANNTGTVAVTVEARANVGVAISGSPSPATAGQNLTYVVTASNAGPSSALVTAVLDSLPLNVLFVSASPSAGSCGVLPTANSITAPGNRVVSCTVGTVGTGAQRTVTIVVRPTTAQRGTSITNSARVSTSTVQPAGADVNDSTSILTPVNSPSLDLLVNKTESVDPMVVGTTTVYTVTATNQGPSDAETLVITDSLPTAGLSFQSLNAPGGTCGTLPAVDSFGGVISCTFPRLAAGASTAIQVTMRGEVKGIYTNRARVTSDEVANGFDTDSLNNRISENTTVRTRADVEVVSKTANLASVPLRRSFLWTIAIRNNSGAGLNEADSVVVTDNLPAGMQLTATPTVTVTGGTTTLATCTGTVGSTSFTCALGTVSSGGTADISVPVRTVVLPSGGTTTNTASISTSSLDVNSGNNSSSGSIAVTASSLSGRVFRDFNDNATPDGTDTGITGIGLTVSGTAFDGAPVSASGTTDASGVFTIGALPEGTYTLTRGTVSETFLVTGTQTAGTAGGTATTPPSITGIALGSVTAATDYRFAFVPTARIGVNKRLPSAATINTDGSFTAVLSIAVRNFSLEAVDNVAITDPLAGASPLFGTYVPGGAGATLTPGSYTIQAAPSFQTACTGGVLNSAFTGDADQQLATIASLAVNAGCTVNFTLRYQPVVPLPGGSYTNLATATATGALSGQAVSDQSQNGTNPDPDGDNDPRNNTARTPLNPVLTADVTTAVTLPATVAAGQPVAGTVLYRNTGPYAGAGLTYTLSLSPSLSGGVTFGNLPAGATAAYNGATGAVTFTGMPTTLAAGQIASGDGTGPITVSYTQNGVASTVLSSTIATTTNEGANTNPNSSNATVSGPLVADVTTTVSMPASANAGEPVSGTVVFRNTGPSTASGVTYSLTLASGLSGVTFGNLPGGVTASYASSTGVVTFTGMPATLTAGTLVSGNGTSGITVSYTQPPSGTSTVATTIGTSTSQGANVQPDAATATVAGVPIADVLTALSFPVSVDAGQPVSGTITFRNDGPSTAAAVTYGLTLSSGLTGVTFGNLPAGATATYSSASGAVTFTGMPVSVNSGVLVSGNGTTPITLTYVQNAVANSTISSTIGTSTNQGANVGLDAASANPGGGLIADVRALVTAPPTADAGTPLTAVVTFSNTGPSVASGVTYALTLTPGLGVVTFGNLPAGATATYASATGVVTFTGMPTTLASGAIASGNGTSGITIATTQNAVASTTIGATIGTATNQGANIAPDTDTRTITGQLIADVTTTLTGFPTLVPPGVTVSGQLTFRNAGPSAASGMTYGVTLAQALTGVTFSNLPAGATTSYNGATGVVTFSGMPASIAPNAIVSGTGSTPITVSYTQSTALSTSVASTIGTSTNQGTNTLPDAASVVVSGLQGTDLVVTKTAAVTEVTPVDTITYTVRARNAGPVGLPAGSVLTDVPVGGITLVGVQCSPLSGNLCTSAPSVSALTAGASLPALPVNGSFELLVRAAVTAPNGGTITNRALGGLPVGYFDTDSTNNQQQAGPLPVRARPDVAVRSTVDADTLRYGAVVDYLLTVVNRGTASTAGPVTLTETLPTGLQPTAARSPEFACTIAGQTVTCTRTTLMAVTDSSQITIATRVTPSAPPPTVALRACQSTIDDVNASNDCASVARPIGGRREVALTKRAVGEFIVGNPSTWLLTIRNTGTVPVDGPFTLVDTLPTGLTFRNAVGAGWQCSFVGQVVTCTRGSPLLPVALAVGDSSTVTLTTLVERAAVPQVTNCGRLTVGGGALQPNDGTSCATVLTRADYRLVLELTTPRYEREVGEAPDFTVIVRNVGLSPLPDVELTNLLPRGFSYVPRSSAIGPNGGTLVRVEDPVRGPTNSVAWPLGTLAPGQAVRVDYRALIGLGATFQQDNITIASARSTVPGLQVTSNSAQVPIRLGRGLFDNRGTIAGKVYVECDCDRTAGQGTGEVGIPGVRVLLEDGTGAITDAEGKYNFINVRAGLHVVKVDRSTLPAGAEMTALVTRNAGDGWSRFVDLKGGELHRADFAEGSRRRDVLDAILARRTRGEVDAAGERLLQAAGQQLGAGGQGTMPVQAPVLGAPRAAAPAVAQQLTYVPLAPANALHDGNSNLPITPLRATAAVEGQPNLAGMRRVEVQVARDAVPANGRTMLPVTVRITDAAGQPVRGSVPVTLEASAGGWQAIDANATARGSQVVVTNGEGTFMLVAPNAPVIADVRATAPMGASTTRVTFTPESRDFTAVGLVQGRVDLRRLARGSLDLSNAADAFEDALSDLTITRDSGRVRAGARGALLLKGTVKNMGLLTLAYDTERDRERTQFRDITPDQGWAVFGDASLREFDAQSQQRLYARLDRGASYLRYGDFATPRSDDRRLLLAYDRSMTGLTWHGESRRGEVNSFVSRNRIRQRVDELPGRGLSGPYFITAGNALINSERVEIVTRDRNQPSVILKSQPMARFEEYTIEPLTGRVLFRAPVPSMDANLNPVTIRITYEVEQGGAEFLTYGGDGRLKLGKALELGGFAVRDENPVDAQTMLGASAALQMGTATTAMAEVARTDNEALGRDGLAWRVEVRHQSERMEGRVFAMASDTGFANQSSTFAGGRTELGMRWNARLGDRTRLIADALHTADERTGGERTGALAGIERRFGAVVAEVGYRWAVDNGRPVSPLLGGGLGSTLTGGQGGSVVSPSQFSFSAARARLSSRVPGSSRSTVFGEYEYGLDATQARRGAVGGEYLAFNRARLYLRHEWLTSQRGPYALGEDRTQQQTVFGMDADYLRNGQVFSEYRARDAFNGRDAEASIGLRNRWALRPGLLLNTSMERVTPLIGQVNGTAFAATSAVEWTQPARSKTTARLEWRTSPTGENLLGSLGYARKLTRDWTLLGRTLWDQMMSDAVRGRSQLGLAWRQTDRNRVNALFRLENRLDRSDAQGAPTTRTLSNVAAMVLNWQAVPRWTISSRYAAKLASDQRDDITVRSTSQLVMARSIIELSRRVDVGVIGSVLGTQGFSQRRHGLGGELGLVVMRNLRLAGGYNLFGFTDRDFDTLGYTQRGAYLEFGFKFDEGLFGRTTPTQGASR